MATLLFVATTACGSGTAGPARKTPAPPTVAATSLATSVETSAGSWAVVPMGHPDQPLNTFWQLFFRPTGSDHWSDEAASLAVATNGGLVMATVGSSLAVGIRPANLLSFSPLLVRPATSGSWRPVTPVAALAASPDAIAFGAGGRALALSAKAAGGEIFAGSAALTTWSEVTTAAALGSSAAGRACGLTSMTAVGFAGGDDVIGADCEQAGVAGVFVGGPDRWRLASLTLPSSLDRGRVSVLGLQPTSTGLCALLAVADEHGTSLLAAWDPSGTAGWRLSPVWRIGRGRVLSVGADGTEGLFVLSSDAVASESVELVAGPGTPWRSLPAPPDRTSTLVFAPAGRVDALVVNDTAFADWELAGGARHWVRTQAMNVPIEFGSSS